ncbi:MAG: putative cytochrome b5 [Terrestrivirus sp.]|uniref:Putative cytochrome b5 n=1 Tax=Terrestrivirus sp. TaxID=2487775 RepID=A0A3G4ZK34_9VIRU|nr:MAG: putative cytochrome b5 [Terrestrivirus sp.]
MTSDTKYFTREEVSKHNSESDCWIILNNSVYDVTSFLQDHPGGSHAIMTCAGKDATDDFKSVCHSSSANTFKEDFLVGKLREDQA